jgi:hypothetical protein
MESGSCETGGTVTRSEAGLSEAGNRGMPEASFAAARDLRKRGSAQSGTDRIFACGKPGISERSLAESELAAN